MTALLLNVQSNSKTDMCIKFQNIDDNDTPNNAQKISKNQTKHDSNQNSAKSKDGLRKRNANKMEKESPEVEIKTKEDNSCKTFDGNSNTISWMFFTTSLALAAFAMFFKETGFSVLGFIIVYEVMEATTRKRSLVDVMMLRFSKILILKIFLIVGWGVACMVLRMQINAWTLPRFSEVINPIPFQERIIIRLCNYLYLCWYNFALLLCPTNLSYDYSFDSIPLITSTWDIRNLISFTFIVVFIAVSIFGVLHLQHKAKWARALVFGTSFMTVTFLPAANLIFTVGFVVAERVLYLPSAGFIVVLVLVWQSTIERFPFAKKFLHALMASLTIFYVLQTINRSYAWGSESMFHKASLESFPRNCRIHYNMGNYLQTAKKFKKAMHHYQTSIDICPKLPSTLNNMAILMQSQKMSKIEIEKMYRKVIEITPNDAKAYTNLGRLLIKQNRTDDVIELLAMARNNVNNEVSSFLEMIQYLKQRNTTHAHSAYFGVVKSLCSSTGEFKYLKDCSKALERPMQDILKKKKVEAGESKKIRIYEEVVKKIKAVNLPTMKSYARALSNAHSIEEAFTYMINDIEQSNQHDDINESDDHDKIWYRAITFFRNQRYTESKELYETYINLHPENLNARGQYGALLFQTGERQRGEKVLFELTEQDQFCRTHEIWLNLATIYLRKANYEEGINLLQNCLDGMSTWIQHDEQYNKQIAAVLVSLANQQFLQSKVLKKNENLEKAEKLKGEAYKNISKALKLDPENRIAQRVLFEMEEVN